MKNTIENKKKFYSLYYGVEVFNNELNKIYDGNYNIPLLTTTHHHGEESGEFLELKPITSITDEDAGELLFSMIKFIGLDGIIQENSIDLVKQVIINHDRVDILHMLPSEFADSARSKGYAFPYMGITIEEQVEFGWVKLKD